MFSILDNGNPIGRGTVVEAPAGGAVGLGITAWHVLSRDVDGSGPIEAASDDAGDVQPFGVRFANGRQAKGCWCVRRDKSRDLALIQIWVPGDVPAVPVGWPDELGDGAAMVGRSGVVVALPSPSLVQSGCVFFDGRLVPGDSGGGVFMGGKLVGVVSGGWFWLESEPGMGQVTWPVRAGRVDGFFPEGGE